jgi:hypothetical protein
VRLRQRLLQSKIVLEAGLNVSKVAGGGKGLVDRHSCRSAVASLSPAHDPR